MAGIIKDGGSMSKLDEIIKSSDTLRSLANTIGMKQEVEVPPEVPNPNIYANTKLGTLEKDPLYAVPRSTIPTDLPQNIRAYRADPTGKYGGKEGLETLPIGRFLKGGDQYIPQDLNPATSNTYSDPSKAIKEIYRYARLTGAAERDGLPTISAQELASFILQEGRSDAGMSGGSYGGYADKVRKDLVGKYNIPNEDVSFLTTVADKKRVADRLGISFAEAWNGTGKSIAGKTGKDYARDMEGTLNIADHPKNAELMAIIKKGIEDGKKHGLPLNETRFRDSTPGKKKVPYNAGGGVEMPDEYSKGSWKLI